MTEDINPKHLLLEAINYSQREDLDLHYPVILVLHTLLHEFCNTDNRIEVLDDIISHLNIYLEEINIPQPAKCSLLLECKSLRHYISIIDDLLTDKGRRIFFNDNKDTIAIPRLEQIIYLQNLKTIDTNLHHYIAFIEGYGYFAGLPDKIPTTSAAVLYCGRFLGEMYSKDIFDFCRHLFCGEAVRLHEIGASDDQSLLGIHNFDVSFRNRCFDVFIELKTRDIGIDMVKDNDRLYPPTDLDCLNQLLEESEYAVNREEQFEQFRGSIAYEKLYYVGRPDVLKMSQYFVLYLRDKINSLSASANPTKIEHHYHDHSVHEDYSKSFIVNNSDKCV